MANKLATLTEQIRQLVTDRAYSSINRILLMDSPALWELRLTPANQILCPQELADLDDCEGRPCPGDRVLPSQIVVIVKATRLCNLRCSYCNSWREGPGQVMPFSVLAALTRDVLLSPTVKSVDFVWHGGEVTLLKPEYLRKAIWLQEFYRNTDVVIANSIQTNATKLTKGWIRLFKDFKVSVGVSIDGPAEIHDLRRVRANGTGSWNDVKRGIDLLRDNDVHFGALAVVDECVIQLGAERYLRYLVELGVKQVALLNALPRNTDAGPGSAKYLPHLAFAQFLRDLFRSWWCEFRSEIEIRELQALVESVSQGGTGLCIFSRRNCMGQYLTVEPEGDVSACDKYVGIGEYVFGNIRKQELSEMMSRSTHLRIAKVDVQEKKSRMANCKHFRVCFGGCPHDVRLSERYQESWTSDCCGMSELIDDISLSIASNG